MKSKFTWDKILPLVLSILIPIGGAWGGYQVLRYRVDQLEKNGGVDYEKINGMIRAELEPFDEKFTQGLKEHSDRNVTEKAGLDEHIRIINVRLLEVEKSLYRTMKR